MKIYLPFTKLRAETFASIPDSVLVPLCDKTFGYWHYFRERWSDGRPFISVEQDVVCPPGFLGCMKDCEALICFASYIYPGQPERLERGTYLGCVKISAGFISDNCDLFNGECKDWHAPEAIIWNAVKDKPPCYHDSVMHLHVDSRWPIEEINRF